MCCPPGMWRVSGLRRWTLCAPLRPMSDLRRRPRFLVGPGFRRMAQVRPAARLSLHRPGDVRSLSFIHWCRSLGPCWGPFLSREGGPVLMGLAYLTFLVVVLHPSSDASIIMGLNIRGCCTAAETSLDSQHSALP